MYCDDPRIRLRDIAASLDITERSAYAIVGDLAAAGYVLKEREGRRNHYVVQRELPLPESSPRHGHDRRSVSKCSSPRSPTRNGSAPLSS